MPAFGVDVSMHADVGEVLRQTKGQAMVLARWMPLSTDGLLVLDVTVSSQKSARFGVAFDLAQHQEQLKLAARIGWLGLGPAPLKYAGLARKLQSPYLVSVSIKEAEFQAALNAGGNS